MPKIEVPENIFYELLGRRMTDDELLDIFPVAKAELDGHDTEGHVIIRSRRRQGPQDIPEREDPQLWVLLHEGRREAVRWPHRHR